MTSLLGNFENIFEFFEVPLNIWNNQLNGHAMMTLHWDTSCISKQDVRSNGFVCARIHFSSSKFCVILKMFDFFETVVEGAK